MPFDNSPVTSPVIEALREGRKRVERGWCQGVGDRNDRYCAMVALNRPQQAEIDAAASYLRAAGGFPTNVAIVFWNDSPERTQADVLALYDKAIELAVQEALGG